LIWANDMPSPMNRKTYLGTTAKAGSDSAGEGEASFDAAVWAGAGAVTAAEGAEVTTGFCAGVHPASARTIITSAKIEFSRLLFLMVLPPLSPCVAGPILYLGLGKFNPGSHNRLSLIGVRGATLPSSVD
jgi:hypothetical protein